MPKGVTIKEVCIGVIPFVLLPLMLVAVWLLFPQANSLLPQPMYGSGG